MPENEVIYRTNLDFDKTLDALRNCPKLSVRHESEASPPGIFYVSKKSDSRVVANIGSNGGVQIHYDDEAALDSFIRIVKSNIVVQNGERLTWSKTKKRLGRSFYIRNARILLEVLEEELNTLKELFEMPGKDSKATPEQRIEFLAASTTRFAYYIALVGKLKIYLQESMSGIGDSQDVTGRNRGLTVSSSRATRHFRVTSENTEDIG